MTVKMTCHEKSRFRVVLACCVGGIKLPPMLIFKRETMPKVTFSSAVIVQENVEGWMEENAMSVWLGRCFSGLPNGSFHAN